MARIKYYYDTETCKYERVKASRTDIAINMLGFLFVSLIISAISLVIYNTYFDSPKEALLKKENEELGMYYEILDKEIAQANRMMEALQERDDNVYRVIFEAAPIPSTIRSAGVGGSNRYKQITEKGLQKEELLVNTFQKVDKLKKQMYIQTKSYDEIVQLAKDKSKMLAAMPAIQPVANKELTRLASGFGMRMHPILKTRRMHTGCDFAAPRGTPINATGDGKVITLKRSFGGYGNEIEIDHGYGFITKYAHLDDFKVKLGQKVKRGELIGLVGNTGRSTAPHLHYEIIKDSKKIDPVHYFYKDINEEEYEKLLELSSQENQSL
ncbi:MAG: M23 family metallopeptidase [Bacteroidota bacterium]|nr:M23 family metallopeptidase [Bacteroidota bacterium]